MKGARPAGIGEEVQRHVAHPGHSLRNAGLIHLVVGGLEGPVVEERPPDNIGARNERRNIDIAKSVLAMLDKPDSLIRFVKDRPGHDRRYAIDPTLVESELGWFPQETWESGLRKTIEWYRTNIAWVERARSGAYREFYARQYGVEAGAR